MHIPPPSLLHLCRASPAHPFFQLLLLLLAVRLVSVSHGNATTFRIPLHLSSPIRKTAAHALQAALNTRSPDEPKADGQVTRKKKIKSNAQLGKIIMAAFK